MRRLTTNAILISMSLILFTLEGILPPIFLPPGAKFGLANVVTVVALYKLSEIDALIILSARIFFAGIFAGSPTIIFFSMSSGLLSLAAMILLRRTIDTPHMEGFLIQRPLRRRLRLTWSPKA